MVGDALGIVGAVHEQRNQVRLRIGEVLARDLDQVVRDVGLHLVDLLFVGLELRELGLVDMGGAEMMVDGAVDHAPGQLDHLLDLDDRLLDGHGGHAQEQGFQGARADGLGLVARDERLAEVRERLQHGHDGQDRDDVEDRVRHGDVALQILRHGGERVARRDGVHDVEEEGRPVRSDGDV